MQLVLSSFATMEKKQPFKKRSSETLISTHKPTRRYNPQYQHLHFHRHKNLKYQFLKLEFVKFWKMSILYLIPIIKCHLTDRYSA
jgi:hypothetical protein